MTLCTAWIRQVNNTEELVFATDSTLTGGEKWDNGIKLFELPRKDCLLCFAGSTFRAYPLILNLISSIKFNIYLKKPETDITEVLNYISDLFTNLIKTIVSEIKGEDIHELRSGAKFLFGGWCWQSNCFRIWYLYYSSEADGFLFEELTKDDSKTRFYTFLGDPKEEIEKEAKDRFKNLLMEEERYDSKLNMEPLSILRDIALEKSIREVGGSLQIAKVYKSGRSEFFGILWPSSVGKPFFQGREYNDFNKPKIKFFNPDTCELMDLEVPQRLTGLMDYNFGMFNDLINECYPDGILKDNVSEKDRHILKTVLQEVTYSEFIKVTDKNEEEI
ncbi:MAG: hypothetical protein WCL51_05970 [Bacteroidota bacterium]